MNFLYVDIKIQSLALKKYHPGAARHPSQEGNNKYLGESSLIFLVGAVHEPPHAFYSNTTGCETSACSSLTEFSTSCISTISDGEWI